MATAHIVVDYQNIHLTAHDYFCPERESRHLCLIHPLHFANQVLRQRNLIKRLLSEKDGTDFVAAELGSVSVYRGQPSNHRDSVGYSRTQKQRSEWTRDARVEVTYRTLKYDSHGAAREKGVDVMVALQIVQKAAQADEDTIVILAAHDTDQEPALELGHRLIGDRLETAGWAKAKRLRVPGVDLWHTALDQDAFDRTVDRRDYT